MDKTLRRELDWAQLLELTDRVTVAKGYVDTARMRLKDPVAALDGQKLEAYLKSASEAMDRIMASLRDDPDGPAGPSSPLQLLRAMARGEPGVVLVEEPGMEEFGLTALSVTNRDDHGVDVYLGSNKACVLRFTGKGALEADGFESDDVAARAVWSLVQRIAPPRYTLELPYASTGLQDLSPQIPVQLRTDGGVDIRFGATPDVCCIAIGGNRQITMQNFTSPTEANRGLWQAMGRQGPTNYTVVYPWDHAAERTMSAGGAPP